MGLPSDEESLLAQIVSRGQILSMKREPYRTLTSISVPVTHDMAPSFYFVAFYYHKGLPVANSLRVNIQTGACEGQVMTQMHMLASGAVC